MKNVKESAQLVFASKVVVAIAGLCALMVLMVFRVSNVERFDEVAYEELVASSQAADFNHGLTIFTGKQHRENVQKDIIFSEADGRRQMRLVSQTSDLVFTYGGGGDEVVEYLNGVSCDIQEELYYTLPDGREVKRHSGGQLSLRHAELEDPMAWIDGTTQELVPMQRVRHVEAGTATYHYRKDLFAADQVDLTRYFVPEHQLPELGEELLPMMQGHAQAVQFSVVGRQTVFQAYHLKMTLYSKEGLL